MEPSRISKQSTNAAQVSVSNMMPVPMSIDTTNPGSVQNIMSVGQNVIVTDQNLNVGQPGLMHNVQILNMRPGAPPVAAQKSIATVPPRVVLGSPQVVGASRAQNPAISLQTLQTLQHGQQGHLLFKNQNGQYQLLRVGPAPGLGTLAAPPTQSVRLTTAPAIPTMSTGGGYVPASQQPAPAQMPGAMQMVYASGSGGMPMQMKPQPQTATLKPSDNTKEKCRSFLSNLLDLSSKEPPSVENNVRSLIQELIDARVEPEQFCDRLERLLNASPQPCLIGFLKKSLPLLRQSMVTNELGIEGISPPAPHIAFPNYAQQWHQPMQQTMQLVEQPTQQRIPQPIVPAMPLLMPYYVSPFYYPHQQFEHAMLGNIEQEMMQSFEIPLSEPPLQTFQLQCPAEYATSGLQYYTDELIDLTEDEIFKKPAHPKPAPIALLQNIPVQAKTNASKVPSGKGMTVNKTSAARGAASAVSTVVTPAKSQPKEKERKSSQYSTPSFSDDKMAGDEDINDVAAMGGVNLAEETQRILGSTETIGTQIRSCKEEYLVPTHIMQARLTMLSEEIGMGVPGPNVAEMFSHAVQYRLTDLIERLAVIAEHRMDAELKTDERYEETQNVSGQLKFLEDLDRLAEKRREDSEREVLMRAAKSRSKNEDPEQAKLKAKAKEMQRVEMEEVRQRDANVTALQAIGPRKKQRTEPPPEVASTSADQPSTSTGRGQVPPRARVKRVTMRDAQFMMENDIHTAHSLILYKSYL